MLKKCRLLRTPDETQRPVIRQAMDETYLIYEKTLMNCPDLIELANDPKWNAIHVAFNDRAVPRERGQVNSVEATASMKINEADTITEAVSYLNKQEQAKVLTTPDLFRALSDLAK
jgi:membrane glycosyltransferase